MKKLVMIALMAFSFNAIAQSQETYLMLEWMGVDNEQWGSYMETEDFWEKIHQERVKNGDIVGWDLWAIQPGGESQNFQYLVVHVHNDPIKMMNGSSNIMELAKRAYPNMSEEEISAKMNGAAKTRDIEAVVYTHLIDRTEGGFDMPLGTVSRVNLMKAEDGAAYVKAEREIFKPNHQQRVDSGALGSWSLTEVMVPWGSDVYANYYTFDMFKDYEHMFSSGGGSGEMTEEVVKGLATREIKWGAMATLIKKVR